MAKTDVNLTWEIIVTFVLCQACLGAKKVDEIVLSNNKSFIHIFSFVSYSAQASKPKPKELTPYLDTQQVHPYGTQFLLLESDKQEFTDLHPRFYYGLFLSLHLFRYFILCTGYFKDLKHKLSNSIRYFTVRLNFPSGERKPRRLLFN